MIISRSILLRMVNIPNKFVKKIKRHIPLSVTSHTTTTTLPPENHAVYEIMWENKVQPDRSHMTV
jgi:hypothetical protein